MTEERLNIRNTRRWVVKIGSALITNNGCGLKYELLDNWVSQFVELNKQGIEIVLVSSGAVAEGLSRLAWENRPNAIHELQAAAAVGQMGLIQAYEVCFQRYDRRTAQILLTHDDIVNRTRYLNARTSLNTLLKLGVVPIVNENDSVATDEICFGDNDTLAGLVANLIEAELLVLLTDQNGLYDADPRKKSTATLIEQAEAGDQSLFAFAGEGGSLGRGGMRTKLKAAMVAMKSDTQTVIASGHENTVLLKIAKGETVGTLLTTKRETLQAKKQWLANQVHLKGKVLLDAGAVKALKEQGKSLLPVGIKGVEGEYKRGEIIACIDESGKEIARGLTNYDSIQTKLILGKSSQDIQKILEHVNEEELIHRDNLILISAYF